MDWLLGRNKPLDASIRRTKSNGGGNAAYGYTVTDCEEYRKYIDRFWHKEGVFVFNEYDPDKEYLKCSVVVHGRLNKQD